MKSRQVGFTLLEVVVALAIASIRSANHVTEAALAGADVATIPPAVIYKLADHPLTKSGLEQFVKDWKATGQSIL